MAECRRLAHLEPTVRVEVASLLPADSPRLAGEDAQHTQMLANLERELPPIIVHRPTMRVIDGMHRLYAAMLRGQETIDVRFFDGADDVAFVLAVESNVKHGLPLSLRDREAAAARIIGSHPQWSDRVIASVAGLAAKTVGAIRARNGPEFGEGQLRLGRDGKLRPLNAAFGRIRASEILASKPGAPLRDVARAAGVSAATVRDVRERMRRGEDPVPPKQRAQYESAEPHPGGPAGAPDVRALTGHGGTDGQPAQSHRLRSLSHRGPLRDRSVIMESLRRDPTLRYSESGRSLLRWLETRIPSPAEWKHVIYAVPPHCSDLISELACGCANDWLTFADLVTECAESTA